MANVVRGPWPGAGPDREPGCELWAALWPELSCAPSERMEQVISELVAEIGQLQAKKGQPLRDPAAWLRGLALDWPPATAHDYRRLFEQLKSKKAQLSRADRRGNRATRGQIAKIWATLRDTPHLDKDWLYDFIGDNFKHARRDGKPSVSQLTSYEAARIIDRLEGRA